MKFCDKLQKIRKENNITQEQLADKLNVSRQAVSKWESGVAYPDTDRLIQISKIFNVSLDELVNDNKDGSYKDDTKKMNFMEIFDIVFEFITKSFNMFWAMKFMDKVKCLFEMSILVLVIIMGALFSTSLITEIVRRIFMFIPGDFVYILCNLVDTLLYVVWIILGGIIFVRVFKTRYLDYYVVITDNKIEEKVIEEPIKELKKEKEYKVVIRDPEHSSLNLLRIIQKLFNMMLKIFSLIILIPVVLLFISCMVILVISLFYLFDGLFFNGISLTLFGIVILVYLVIEFIYNIVFNRRHAISRIFIMFITSISLVSIGIGLSFVSLSSFTLIDDLNKTESHIINMKDNLLLYDIYNIPSEKIIIDDSLDYIKLDIVTDYNSNVYVYGYENIVYNNMNGEYDRYKMIDIVYECDKFELVKDIFNNLKERKIVNYNSYYEIDKIYISSDNLTKLRDNYIKYSY